MRQRDESTLAMTGWANVDGHIDSTPPVCCRRPPPLLTSHTNMPILGLTEQGPSRPAHFNLESIIRPNILALVPYRSARDDYDSGILLDANENALGPCLPAIHDVVEKQHEGADVEDMPRRKEEKDAQQIKTNGNAAAADASDPLLNMSQEQLASLNRYPSPTHDPLKQLIANLRGVPNENWVFLGVGSDEVIDLLFRVTCVPGKDVVITTPPTYGMYEVTANVNDVGVVKVPLITDGGKFEVDMPAVRPLAVSSHSSLSVCSSRTHSPSTPRPSSYSCARPETRRARSSRSPRFGPSPRTRRTRVSSSSMKRTSISRPRDQAPSSL